MPHWIELNDEMALDMFSLFIFLGMINTFGKFGLSVWFLGLNYPVRWVLDYWKLTYDKGIPISCVLQENSGNYLLGFSNDFLNYYF